MQPVRNDDRFENFISANEKIRCKISRRKWGKESVGVRSWNRHTEKLHSTENSTLVSITDRMQWIFYLALRVWRILTHRSWFGEYFSYTAKKPLWPNHGTRLMGRICNSCYLATVLDSFAHSLFRFPCSFKLSLAFCFWKNTLHISFPFFIFGILIYSLNDIAACVQCIVNKCVLFGICYLICVAHRNCGQLSPIHR